MIITRRRPTAVLFAEVGLAKTGPVKKVVVDKARAAALLAKALSEREASDAMKTIARYKEKIKNPRTAIRAKCIECSGGSVKEVNECRVTECPLYMFRMGANPFHKKTRERLGLDSNAPDDEDDDDDDEGFDQDDDDSRLSRAA